MATASSNLGASSTTIRHALVAIAVLMVIAAAGIGGPSAPAPAELAGVRPRETPPFTG